MSRVDKLQAPLRDATGLQRGILHISCVPNQTPPPLWDYRTSDEKSGILQDLRVLEDEEYIYRVEIADPGQITTDKPEVFMPDYVEGLAGRFRPGLNVGEMAATFLLNGGAIGTVIFEVLSKKISYLTDYQAMLKNIASYLAEIIVQRFAPSEQDFSPLEGRDAVTLYQQFAFVRSFLVGDEFREAVRRVLATPDQQWVISDEERPIVKGIRNPAGLVTALSRPGPRQSNPGGHFNAPTLPVFVMGQIFNEDVDTPENRFLFHIFENWLELALLVRDRLTTGNSAAQQRGVREADEVIAILEEILAGSLFKKLGQLGYVPFASTVLQRKEGYREIYRVFLEVQLAAQLSWEGADSVYGAGKKDIALLYEYWVFLTLTKIISTLCGLKPLKVSALIEKTPDGLGLKLRQDRRFALRGALERHGKKIDTVLFYNWSFKPSNDPQKGSWTREMVPDCSVLFRENAKPEHSVWLHFDAKYKVDSVVDLFGPEFDKSAKREEPEKAKTSSISYKREDLLKMHAYKDAVRRSIGAYVLYPGTEKTVFKQFNEIVPGIGAFALRPSESGPEGAAILEQFFSDVLEVFSSADTAAV